MCTCVVATCLYKYFKKKLNSTQIDFYKLDPK